MKQPATLDLATAPWLTYQDLVLLMRNESVVRRMIAAGWLKSISDNQKAMFTRKNVDSAMARYESGDPLPQIKKEKEAA